MHKSLQSHRSALVLLGFLGLALVSAPPVGAADPNTFPYQYMVKFVCGFLSDPPPVEGTPPLKPGNYATAINIHNYTPQGMASARRVALHYRPGTAFPPVPPAQGAWVRSRRVLEVDCVDIWGMASVAPETFLKGMVHIGLPQRLPVAAVYTSQTDLNPLEPIDAGAGISIDVENVLPFIVPLAPEATTSSESWKQQERATSRRR